MKGLCIAQDWPLDFYCGSFSTEFSVVLRSPVIPEAEIGTAGIYERPQLVHALYFGSRIDTSHPNKSSEATTRPATNPKPRLAAS
jgi:hypothetical protein